MPGGVTAPMESASAAAVLVVDDEPAVRKVVCRWLAEAGLSAAEVPSADAAWDYLQQHEVPVVTLDVSMPRRSGRGPVAPDQAAPSRHGGHHAHGAR